METLIDNYSEIDDFYCGLSVYLCLHNKEAMGVKSYPEQFNYSGFITWMAGLDLEELDAVKAYFYDKWNFETCEDLDRALFKIFYGWELFRREELHQSK